MEADTIFVASQNASEFPLWLDIADSVALILTLAAVVWYTYQTHRMRKQGEEQLKHLRQARIRELDPVLTLHSSSGVFTTDEDGPFMGYIIEIQHKGMRNVSVRRDPDFPHITPELSNKIDFFFPGIDLLIKARLDNEECPLDVVQFRIRFDNAGGYRREFTLNFTGPYMNMWEVVHDELDR